MADLRQSKYVSSGVITDLIYEVLVKLGSPVEDSQIVADSLCSANLRGVDTHGVRILTAYARRVRDGSINTRAEFALKKETLVSALADGQNGFGQVNGKKAMTLAISKAKTNGIGIVSLYNTNHFGAAAYYSMMAQNSGLIGFVATNASPRMPPTGGAAAVYGNNPWSIAFPCAQGDIPLVLDMATSVVAQSRINMAARRGDKIPFDWGLTEDGLPTDDPNLAKLLLPFGGYKGYGISVAIEALTGILSGARFGPDVIGNNEANTPAGQNIGQMFTAIDVEMFMPLTEYTKRLASFVNDLKSCPKAKGTEQIYLPGEIEMLKMQERLASGVPIEPAVVEDINRLCDEVGVSTKL